MSAKKLKLASANNSTEVVLPTTDVKSDAAAVSALKKSVGSNKRKSVGHVPCDSVPDAFVDACQDVPDVHAKVLAAKKAYEAEVKLYESGHGTRTDFRGKVVKPSLEIEGVVLSSYSKEDSDDPVPLCAEPGVIKKLKYGLHKPPVFTEEGKKAVAAFISHVDNVAYFENQFSYEDFGEGFSNYEHLANTYRALTGEAHQPVGSEAESDPE